MSQRQRSEDIEREALLSLHQCCPSDAASELDLFCYELGDALAVGAGRDPSILLNRCLGLGVRQPQPLSLLRDIDAKYRDHGVSRYFLHAYDDSLEGGNESFAEIPLVPARGWMKFHRGPEAAHEGETELRVERADQNTARHFGTIVAEAFGMTEAAAPLLAGLVNDERWHLLVSYAGDAPAGAGALFVDGDTAWFEWGATRPEFRRRGSQGAIMRERIRRARELGCTHMFTETGEASGDDPQHSYGNIQRYGFVEDELRRNWAPPR